MKNFIIIFIIILSTILHCDSLTTKLQNIKTKYQIAGMSVAVVKNNSLVYNKGFGLRDIARNLPVNDSTLYRIASISKMITATALMKLWEQGKFNLDDDISRYLGWTIKNPNFPNDSITFRRVLSHTASLRDGTGYDGFLSATYNNNPPPSISSVLVPGGTYYTANMWSSTRGPNSNYFVYSNINYGLIGTLVEKISGKRFDIFCKENIFDPLNIDGGFNIQDINNINNLAVLYRKSGGTYVAQTDNYQGVKPPPKNLSSYVIGSNGAVFAPQGGLRISSYDLAKLMIVHSNGGSYLGTSILQPATIDTMKKSKWVYNGSNGDHYYGIFYAYGLGCSQTTQLLPGYTLIGHPGEAYGLISDLYYETNGQFGIIFITSGGVWGSGTYSGWYNVEEEVYNAVKSELSNLTHLQDEGYIQPKDFKLFQNYPNPFNPSTTIEFSLPGESFVKLTIYDILGREVQVLNNKIFTAGTHKVNWTPINLSSNIYYCFLEAKSTSTEEKYLEKIKLQLIK